jgi:hypothetical protein
MRRENINACRLAATGSDFTANCSGNHHDLPATHVFIDKPVPAVWNDRRSCRRCHDYLAGRLGSRAVKNDPNGDPIMVVELTQSSLQPGHEVNVQGVLLEMRKSVQINFVRGGFQSVCTQVHPSTLSNIPALETTCTITQNGGHVMTQTLVAAANKEMAWSLSY